VRSLRRIFPAIVAVASLLASAPPSSACCPPIVIVPPVYNMSIMYGSVLNPCQPGTPCGDAAPPECKAWNITPGSAPRCGETARGARKSDRVIHVDPNATGYRPSPKVSAMVKAVLIQQLKQAAGPAEAQRVRDALAGRDFVAIWTRAVASQGLHPNDMADALASYWILSWIIANHNADDPPGAWLAVRNQLWRTMASGQSPALPESMRQAVAEVRVIQFVLQLAAYQNARKSRDAATLARLSDDAERSFLSENKIDLRRLALTHKGFEKRN